VPTNYFQTGTHTIHARYVPLRAHPLWAKLDDGRRNVKRET